MTCNCHIISFSTSLRIFATCERPFSCLSTLVLLKLSYYAITICETTQVFFCFSPLLVTEEDPNKKFWDIYETKVVYGVSAMLAKFKWAIITLVNVQQFCNRKISKPLTSWWVYFDLILEHSLLIGTIGKNSWREIFENRSLVEISFAILIVAQIFAE